MESIQPKLFVATPMYGGQCFGSYAQGILNTSTLMRDNGIQCAFSFLFNESLITRARNSLAHAFLKTDSTHLMFIDADIAFNPADILLMLKADVDVICGIYPKKEINWQGVSNAVHSGVPVDQLRHHTGAFVVNLLNNQQSATVRADTPVEIMNGGTGFMLIKRQVFEKLKRKVPVYHNDVPDVKGVFTYGEPIYEFFSTSIEKESKRLLSEDYHFCQVWRKHGGKVHAAPWVKLSHIGTYFFEGHLIQVPDAPEAPKKTPRKAGKRETTRRKEGIR
jgi:hypothetical protein